MDKPTPERAIELADKIAVAAKACRSIDLSGVAELYEEEEKILRDYADLRRKWDAAVNAEPLMWMGPYYQTIQHSHKMDAEGLYPDFCVPLIRKPE